MLHKPLLLLLAKRFRTTDANESDSDSADSALQGQTTSNDGDITALQDADVALQGQITSNDGDITALQNADVTLQGINAVQTDVDNNETAATTLMRICKDKSRLTTVTSLPCRMLTSRCRATLMLWLSYGNCRWSSSVEHRSEASAVLMLTQAFSHKSMVMIRTFLLCRMASNQKFLHAVLVMQLMQTLSTRTRL